MYIKYMKVIRRIYIVKLYFQALFSIFLSVLNRFFMSYSIPYSPCWPVL